MSIKSIIIIIIIITKYAYKILRKKFNLFFQIMPKINIKYVKNKQNHLDIAKGEMFIFIWNKERML